MKSEITVSDYLHTLPQPIRGWALENSLKEHTLFLSADSLQDAISVGFDFRDNPQGETFWRNVRLAAHGQLLGDEEAFDDILKFINYVKTQKW